MNTNLGGLSVDRLIIHEVPKHLLKDEKAGPKFSEAESPLDDELRLFFRERIVESITSSESFPVQFDNNTSSPVPGQLTQLLNDTNADFCELSKGMATHLFSSQDGTNSGGLLTVVQCGISGKTATAILKLEKEEGVRLRRSKVDGKPTYDLHHIKELILTEKTRLFKIGLFSTNDDGQITGRVRDDQRPSAIGVAKFFLTFLGCRYMDDPQLSTQAFFQAAQNYFNEKVTNPTQRAKGLNHLVSELQSNRKSVNARHFAKTYLPTKARAGFESFMTEKGVPSAAIPKDLGLVESHLKRLIYKFAHGITIAGPVEAMQEHVRLRKGNDGVTTAEVTGTLETVKT